MVLWQEFFRKVILVADCRTDSIWGVKECVFHRRKTVLVSGHKIWTLGEKK